jgi:acetoacetate decarboxylase
MKFGYCMPTASPLYVPPPYNFKDNNVINIVFRTTPETLGALLPPPLLPNLDNIAFVYAGVFNAVEPVKVTYKEAGIGIPAFFKGTPECYYVYLYLDTAAAIITGREIWGWPKKDAEISYGSDHRVFRVSVKREGVEIIHASVDAPEQVKPIPAQAGAPALNLKIIPSVRKNYPPDVLQLTSAGGSSSKKELWRGKAALSFSSSPNDPLGNIPILDVICGEQSIEDMSLDYGEVLVDYLADNQ